MKHYLIYVPLFTLLICGCHKRTDTFQTIDYSCFIDPARIYSIKISSDGHANLYTFNKDWDSKYYHDLFLDKAVLDSLNKLSGLIMNSKFDSIYSLDCVRCVSYCLIIKTKKQNFKVTYIGQLFSDKSLNLLDRLSNNINLIVRKRSEYVDSVYRFESWSRKLFPPSPPGDSNYEEAVKKYSPNYH